MVTGLEVAVLLVALALLFGAYRIVKAVKPFIWNAIVGLLVLVAAEVLLGIGVALGPLTLLVVAVGGAPGALLVLLLALFDVAFVPGTVGLVAPAIL
jgi:hypothetical protein